MALGWLLLLIAGLIVLLLAADLFTDKAGILGRAAGMSAFLIGVTIVAIGTSLPELVSSVLAVLRGADGIVIGNVIGSNVANLGLVLATAGIIGGHIAIQRQITVLDLPFLVASTVLLIVVSLSGTVDRIEAVMLLLMLVVFFHFSINQPAHLRDAEHDDDQRPDRRALPLALVLLGVASVLIFASADLVVQSVIGAAVALGAGTEQLAATVVALGTSLPEVAVTITAARRGQAELAVGNVIGSNIFNALAVTGAAALVAPVTVPAAMLTIGLPALVGITALTLFMLLTQALTRWEGWLLALIYLHFVLWVAGIIG